MNENQLKKIDQALEKKESDVDKIKQFLTGEREHLTKNVAKKFKYLQQIGSLKQKYTHAEIVKIITTQDFMEVGEKFSKRKAYKLIEEMMSIYGDIHKVNKEAERYFAREWYLKVAEEARSAGNFEAATRLRKLADEIFDLFNFEKETGVEPSTYFQQVTIVRSSDPNILKEMQLRQAKKAIHID